MPNLDEISAATITADRRACSRVVKRTLPPAHSKRSASVDRAISMPAHRELPRPSDSPCSHSRRVLPEVFLSRSCSIVERPDDSGPRIVAPARRQSAPACSRSARASPSQGSAPKQRGHEVFAVGSVRATVQLRRPPADMSVKSEKEEAPDEDRRNPHRRIFQTH
jgi:hypothetical protein